MGIERFLNHRVSIVRQVSVLDAGQPTYDDYGQPVRSATTLASNVPAGIQPKSTAELAAISQAGVAKSSHTIYLLPRDVTTADQIVHDAAACPMTVDLPTSTFQVQGVPDAVGAGHHLELDAWQTGDSEAAYATPVGS